MITPELKKKLLLAQQSELDEFHIYKRLARTIRDAENRQVLEGIAEDELRHYNIWKEHTGQSLKPDRFTIRKYVILSRLFGLTFGLKLMERGEGSAQLNYARISAVIAEAAAVGQDENRHENQLLDLLKEERLEYTGSVVLGLNDALVELTGALAGLTFALQNTRLIAMAGLVTGIAASLSMAASEYLSTKSEETTRNPVKASLYTGTAYVFTVAFLILPYLVFNNLFLALGVTMATAILIILLFTYYISVTRDYVFWHRFREMALISVSVAGVSFGLGYLIRRLFGVEV
ncbi:MAG: rubrerythrin family protein [Candidatus Zixiibacteriota bacterium]|nr:MAG: rubrerythrin family protein [candidate division Zixibacteria bacterium]